MLATSLLALTLALPPSGGQSHWQLAVGGIFSYASFTETGVAPRAHLFGGDGTVGVSYFPRAILDDDAAPSLQPFLQRATELALDVSGGGYVVRDPLSAADDRGGTNGSVAAAASGYPLPWLLLHARLRVDYERPDVGPGQLTLPVEIAAGGRFHDLLVSVGWSITPSRIGDGSLDVPFWGGAYVDAYEVIARRLALFANVRVLDGGAAVGGGATLFIARRLGIEAAASGGRAAGADFAGAGATMTWWFTPRVAATLQYRGDWYRDLFTLNEVASHVISLALIARPH